MSVAQPGNPTKKLRLQHPKFLQLKNQLEKLGFHVMIELPSKRGAYGLLREVDKKIWIDPVVFDLNIGNQTLIHETFGVKN